MNAHDGVDPTSGQTPGRLTNQGAGLTLDDLARRIATHLATEAVLFEHLASWIAVTPEPALKPRLAAWSAHHAEHLDMWAGRFPVVPHLHLDELTAAARADLADVERELSQASTTSERLAAALALLERHAAACAADRAAVDPVLDAPTARVLDVVTADVTRDITAVARASGVRSPTSD